jgi:FMN-dependent oxidoreductase (nitrilotriacetate monooxygenase family)
VAIAPRKIHLGMFLQGAGHHLAGWRYPDADSGSENMPHLLRQAVTAERAKFDMVFLADGLTSSEDGHPSQIARFDPMLVLATFATATSRIGLAATVSTTYGEPFHVARAFASLDHLSHGRAAWNAVTTSYTSTGANFGIKHPAHADRYAIAEEFIDVVRGLWDSWEDGAFPRDKAAGIYVDQSKRHQLGHKGQYFSVQGPLNTSRPPQGHPIVVQSGSSVPGQQLAARTADVVFTAHQSLDSAQAFYRELKGRLAAFARQPEQLAIMPGFLPVLGRTEKEARDKLALLDGWTDQSKVVPMLSDRLGHDVSRYDLDGPLPDLPASEQLQSRAKLLTDAARRDNLTLRQLAQMVATGRGHYVMCGTPLQIADRMELWFREGAADGFNVMPPYFPGGLDDFVQGVIPILQERGLFRTEYEGTTLRDHFGFARPDSPHGAAKKAAQS